MNISIAMATYNGERFLQEQLDSLAAQTLLPCELVVGDDGSTDGTLEILERFAGRAPFPVRLHRNSGRLGYADNFLSTAVRCSADWVTFCDQDDVWLPQKIERHSIALESRPWVDIVESKAIRTDEFLRRQNYSWSAWPELIARPSKPPLSALAGHSLTVRKDLIRDFPWETRPVAPSTQKRLSHDVWISILGYLFGSKYFLRDRLILYRRHGGAVTYNSNQDIVEHLRLAWKISEAIFEDMSIVWVDMARWCDESAELTAPSRRNSLQEAAERCRRVAWWYRKRSNLFRIEQDRVTRMKEMIRLVRTGAYPHGFGARAFIKDVARTII